MLHRTRLVKFFIFFICLFVSTHEGWAASDPRQESGPPQINVLGSGEQPRETTAVFVQEGIDAYEDGQIGRAIDRFSRAMLLEPFQETSRRYLVQISQQRGLNASQRAELFLFEDLAAFLDRSRQEKESLSRSCDALWEDAVRSGEDRAVMEAALARMSERFHFSDEVSYAVDEARPPLEALNAAFMRIKEDLSAELLYLQKKYVWLKDRQWDTVPAARADKDFVPGPAPLEAEGRMGIAVKTVHAQASGILPDEIVSMRGELQKLKKELDDLHGYVRAKDAKIALLSDQVVAFSLKLAEQEMLLNEKARLTDAASEQYTDLQSRIELGQKIIEGKNAQIESLQNGLASLQAEAAVQQRELSDMLVLKDGQVQELAGIVDIYKDKLADVHGRLERQQRSAADLKADVAAMRVALFEKETALNKTKQRVNRLEEQLNKAQRRSSRSQRLSPDLEQGSAVEGHGRGLEAELEDIRSFVLREAGHQGKRE